MCRLFRVCHLQWRISCEVVKFIAPKRPVLGRSTRRVPTGTIDTVYEADDVLANVIDEFIDELARALSSRGSDPLHRPIAQLRADLARDGLNLAPHHRLRRRAIRQ
jgi:hypothetical protein